MFLVLLLLLVGFLVHSGTEFSGFSSDQWPLAHPLNPELQDTSSMINDSSLQSDHFHLRLTAQHSFLTLPSNLLFQKHSTLSHPFHLYHGKGFCSFTTKTHCKQTAKATEKIYFFPEQILNQSLCLAKPNNF